MIPATTKTIMFTQSERRLLLLFYVGSASETVDLLVQALSDIHDYDDRLAAKVLSAKLPDVDEAALAVFITESGGGHV
jgi:hypothetical protein